MWISTEICNFYKDYIAPRETNFVSGGAFIKIYPVSRWEFNTGTRCAIPLLVEKIAQSIFFLVGSVLTLGLHEGMRTSLLKNAKEGLIYAGAIPLGILGIFFPQTINQVVLQIPSEGLNLCFKPNVW